MIENPASSKTLGSSQGSLLKTDQISRWAWVWAYTAIVTTLAVVRYGMFVSHGYSLAGYLTAFALILHGHSTLLTTNLLARSIAKEKAWGIWVLAPLAQHFDLSFLFFMGALWVGSGSLAIWRIGLRLGREPETMQVASVLYLLFPTLIAANIYDFHLIVWAIPLVLWLVWFALDGRWIGFLALFGLGTGIGIPVTGAFLLTGLGLVLWRRTMWFGLALWAGTFAYWGLVHRLSFPLPHWVWHGHLDLRAGLYLAWIVLPALVIVGGMVRNRGLLNVWWIPGIVVVGLNVMWGTVASTSPFTDRSALVAPFLALLVVSAGRFPSRLSKVAVLWSVGWVVLMGGYLYHSTWRPRPTNVAELHAALALVPPRATLVSQSYILPHRHVNQNNLPASALYQVPIPAGTYVLIDPSIWDGFTPRSLMADWEVKAHKVPKAHLVYHHAGVWLFRLNRTIPTKT